MGKRAVCARLSLKSPVAAEYVVVPGSHGRLSGQQRLGESVKNKNKKTLSTRIHPARRTQSKSHCGGLRIKNQAERAERGLSK